MTKYAIQIDLNADALAGIEPTGGYADLRAIVAAHGFGHQRGGLYFDGAAVTPVMYALATKD